MPLRIGKPWLSWIGVVMLVALAGCPKPSFGLGEDVDGAVGAESDGGVAGGGGAAGGGGSGKACGSRGLQACANDEFCSYPERARCGEGDAPGVCTVKPEACTEQYDPVCGCDGKTHGNACSASSAGVSIRADGECSGSGGQSCGGLTGEPCPDDQYCSFSADALCGAADATGLCEPKPENCADVFDPVCGCDGVTYGNDCEAAAKGVSVASDGPCRDAGQICGGPISASCPDDQYCKFPEVGQCGDENNETGVCADKPVTCTLDYSPVCGCDGTTYGNACAASAAGVSVESQGECAGTVCGVRGAAECADDEFCEYPAGSLCGAADEPGRCTKRPDVCTADLREVCGCDGISYGNGCTANVAGTSVSSEGPCLDGSGGSGETCGGIAGLQCPDGEFCRFAEQASCGAGDQTGTCRVRPQACTRQYQPVCGCDDQTYSNPCLAESAGTSVATMGECASQSGAQSCGGLIGTACHDTQFCSYPPDAICGAADATGLCEDRPQACTQQYEPVCGCDDQTYGNACAAASSGIPVARVGEC